MAKTMNGLTTRQRDELRSLLLDTRETLERSIRTKMANDARLEADENIETIDRASHDQHHAVAFGVLDRESRLLEEIDAALSKLAAGEYGLCEETLEPIGYPRLKALPWTRFSVAHVERTELETGRRRV